MLLNFTWYFIIYAFLGWCAEVVFAAAKTGKFVNRGFLNGPYCPIYGFGVILVVFLLEPVKDNLFYMFLGSVIITSAIELVVGYILEKAFHQKWWDYSDMPFNIGGHICLLFSLVWGFACLIIVDRIHPTVVYLVSLIPLFASQLIVTIIGCLLIADTISTVKTILKLNKKLEIIDDISLKIREASDNMGGELASKTITLMQKKEDLEENIEAQQLSLTQRKQALMELYNANKEIIESRIFGQKRLLNAFPGLKSIDHKDALEKLRNAILKNQFNNPHDDAEKK